MGETYLRAVAGRDPEGKQKPLLIGILALQGAFEEHLVHFQKVQNPQKPVATRLVKTLEDLKGLDGLVLPGGESTAMAKQLGDKGMMAEVARAIQSGLPTWGTCAGMILMARSIEGQAGGHLGVMDIHVKRNAYGRQVASFIHWAHIARVSNDPLPLVFIRAPYAVSYGSSVTPLYILEGKAVALRQGNMLATAFHPELTDSVAFHQYFVNRVIEGSPLT